MAAADYVLVCNLGDRVVFASAGLLLCLYAYYVEVRKERDAGYRPACDLGRSVSCSRVLTSRYARGLGLVSADSAFSVRNSVLGLCFYATNIFLAFSSRPEVIRFLYYNALVSVVSSLYFAAILVHLRDFCVVCVSTYVCSAALFYLSYVRTA